MNAASWLERNIKGRHDRVGTVIHWELRKWLVFDGEWYQYKLGAFSTK